MSNDSPLSNVVHSRPLSNPGRLSLHGVLSSIASSINHERPSTLLFAIQPLNVLGLTYAIEPQGWLLCSFLVFDVPTPTLYAQ